MILNRQKRVRVVLPPLEKFARGVLRGLCLNGFEVTICLVSDAEMARLNKTYRGKPGPADVLSFPADVAPAFRRALPTARNNAGLPRPRSLRLRSGQAGQVPAASTFLGDIAIAPMVARRNAKRYGRTLADELRILILHGVLHLMGYDHETDSGQMERRERGLRRRLDLE